MVRGRGERIHERLAKFKKNHIVDYAPDDYSEVEKQAASRTKGADLIELILIALLLGIFWFLFARWLLWLLD
jgi:hypothetical protein